MSNVKSIKTVNVPKPKVVKPSVTYDCGGNSFPSILEAFEDNDTELENCSEFYIAKREGGRDTVIIQGEFNATAHTCGFIELGNLEFSGFNKTLTQAEAKETARIFDEVMECFWNQKNMTCFINTNGKNSCLKWEQFLPYSKYWTLVKIYKNPNSGNKLSLWVSNN